MGVFASEVGPKHTVVRICYLDYVWETQVMVPCALKATVVDDRITLMFNNNQMVRVSLEQLTTNDQSTMEYSFVNYMKC